MHAASHAYLCVVLHILRPPCAILDVACKPEGVAAAGPDPAGDADGDDDVLLLGEGHLVTRSKVGSLRKVVRPAVSGEAGHRANAHALEGVFTVPKEQDSSMFVKDGAPGLVSKYSLLRACTS